MPEISQTDLAIMTDRLLIHSELLLSWHKAQLVFHQARQFVSMRNTLEQMAAGEHSNADFSKWAKAVLKAEKAERPKVKRKSKPLVRFEAMS